MTGMQDKLRVGPDFDGPVQARKCTDIIFTLAIILLWITMTGVGISSVREVRVRACVWVQKTPSRFGATLLLSACSWAGGQIERALGAVC